MYYLLQQRHAKLVAERPLSFPTVLVTHIKFGPSDAFGVQGMPSEARTTAKRAVSASVTWDANEGTLQWEGEIIAALNTQFQMDGGDTARWNGNELALTSTVGSRDAANEFINSALAILPAFLSLRLRVFVWIKECSFDLGGSHFKSEIKEARSGITGATTEQNEEAAIMSVRDWGLARTGGLISRIILALYYYRHALRLASLEPDRQSMSAEVTLNLVKAIEIIFTYSRDEARSRARSWGIDEEFFERWIIPLMLIRSELDVAHVASAPLTDEQRQALLDFVGRALASVHSLLSKIDELVCSGKVTLPPCSEALDTRKERLLERIAEYAAAP